MYIKTIKVTNIQGIKSYTFEFKENGLTVFTGPNSNGKSIIVRTTRYIIDGSLSKPSRRKSVVNRDATYGEMLYIRNDGVELLVHVAKEASLTYYSYKEPGKEPVMRYIADKNYKELPIRFGFHYNADCGISLNIAEEEEALLFYKTRNKVNATLIEEARTDTGAQTGLDNIQDVYNQTRRYVSIYKEKIVANKIAINNLQFEDTVPLIDKLHRLRVYLNYLQGIHIPKLPEIQPVPKVEVFDLYVPTLPEIVPVPDVRYVYLYHPKLPQVRYPQIVDTYCNLPEVISIVEEIQSLEKNVCPTCGRGFKDCDC